VKNKSSQDNLPSSCDRVMVLTDREQAQSLKYFDFSMAFDTHLHDSYEQARIRRCSTTPKSCI